MNGDERHCIQRARAGDAGALRALYETHVDGIYRLAYRMGGNAMQAEDWTQESFVRAFSRLEGYRGEASFRTWLGAVAMSVILTGLGRVRRDRSVLVPESESAAAGVSQEPADVALRLAVTQAIDELPDLLRSAFVLHEVEGFPVAEIAAMLDVPVGTIKARLFRAREKLRASLGEEIRPDPRHSEAQ